MSDDGGSSSALQTTLSMGQKFGKFILMGVNVLFLIFSCVLIAVGSYALNNQISKLVGQTLPQGIIVVGVFILLLTFLGYVSAWKEWRLGLGIYAFFITIVTIILFAVGIAVYVKRDQAAVYIIEAWNAGGVDTQAALQIAFWCCGLDVFNVSLASDRYPCGYTTVPSDQVPTSTCEGLMVQSFNDNYKTAGSCGIAFSIIMVVSLAITGYLMMGIRESAVNQAIEKNRARNERDMAKNRKKGKGLKIPQLGADVL